jgi:hypothetical protein
MGTMIAVMITARDTFAAPLAVAPSTVAIEEAPGRARTNARRLPAHVEDVHGDPDLEIKVENEAANRTRGTLVS